MKVLIADRLSPEGIEVLKGAPNIEVIDRPGLKPQELLDIVKDIDAIIVRSSTQITKEVLAAAKQLKIVGRAGVGVDNVDCKAATEAGVVVVNTPGGNATTAAEHTIAMLMSLSRHIPQASSLLHEGKWDKNKFTGTEISGKTLGVIGFGNIGKIVADRAQGLKMRVLVSDPFLTAEAAAKLGVELVALEELYRRADYITVHVPLNDSTQNLINEKAFSMMKKGVRLVNCARGGIIDEKALLQAIDSGKVAGAALDVFAQEPPSANDPLVRHEKVIATPHLGASTAEAQVNVAVQVAEHVRDFLSTGAIHNAVNFPSVSAEMLRVLKPYLTLATKIGSFLGQVKRASRENVTHLHIAYSGSVVDYKTEVLTATLVKTFLEPIMDASVNFINALQVAASRGIVIEVSTTRQTQDFANQIMMTMTAGKQKYLLAGAVFGQENSRFVRFNDFYLEVMPVGYLLVVHNFDRPGVVGRIGTILGDRKINISRLQLALDPEHEPAEAVVFLNIDQPAGQEVQEELRQLENVIAVYQIDLS